MNLTEDEIYRIYETLDASLQGIKDLLKVTGAAKAYYDYLNKEQRETESLLKKFEDKISAIEKQVKE